jgi:transposase
MEYRPLTDEEWEDIVWLLPVQEIGRPRSRDREVFNAILYVLITGCRWSELPRTFPPKSTVHDRFIRWTESGFFERCVKRLRHRMPLPEICHVDACTRTAKKGGANWQSLEQQRHQGVLSRQ